MNLFGYNLNKATKPPKADPKEEAAHNQRVLSTLVNPWETGPGKELWQNEDYNRLVAQYKSWIYICANKNATAIAEAPLRLYVSKPTKESKILVKTLQVNKPTK